MVSFARLSVIQDLSVESDYYYNFTEKELIPIPLLSFLDHSVDIFSISKKLNTLEEKLFSTNIDPTIKSRSISHLWLHE